MLLFMCSVSPHSDRGPRIFPACSTSFLNASSASAPSQQKGKEWRGSTRNPQKPWCCYLLHPMLRRPHQSSKHPTAKEAGNVVPRYRPVFTEGEDEFRWTSGRFYYRLRQKESVKVKAKWDGQLIHAIMGDDKLGRSLDSEPPAQVRYHEGAEETCTAYR